MPTCPRAPLACNAFAGLFTLLLAACSSAPVFAPDDGGAAVQGHVVVRKLAQGRFELQSMGVATGKQMIDSPSWVQVGRIETAHWDIELLALSSQESVVRANLNAPSPLKDAAANTSVEAGLRIALNEADQWLARWLGKPPFRTHMRMHIADADTAFNTPKTAWQPGPISSGTYELNLAAVIPPALPASLSAASPTATPTVTAQEDGALRSRVGFMTLLVRLASHEYIHVHVQNGARPAMPLLADEYFAHTLDRCALILSVFKFQADTTNEQILAAGAELLQSPDDLLNRPFATSSSGGELAVASIGAFLSRQPTSGPPHSDWLAQLPGFCQRVADSQPRFTTVNDGIDWITRQLLRSDDLKR